MFSQVLHSKEKDTWALKTSAELADDKSPLVPGYFPGWGSYVDPTYAGVLRQLPLEKDLPQPLLSETGTKFECCSMDKTGLLKLIFSRSWSPEYSEKIQALGLQDRYEHYIPRWNELMQDLGEYLEGDNPFDELDDEESEIRPGSDIWGVLYHVESSSSAHLVDVRRLFSEDFPGFFNGFYRHAQRSENGKVAYIENGVARDLQQERTTCTPTVQTFGLDKERGIDLSYAKQPIELPVPSGLDDTYNSFLTMSPAGDCLFVAYGDKGDIDGFAFYKYDKGTKRWTKMWQDEEGNDGINGFIPRTGIFASPETGVM